MRTSNLARPLRSPFRPGGVTPPLDRDDVTLSLVDFEPVDEEDPIELRHTLQHPRLQSALAPCIVDDIHASVDVPLDDLSAMENEVVAPCVRLSRICPSADDLEEIEPEPEAGLLEDIWVDVSGLDEGWDVVELAGPVLPCSGLANPFLVE